MKKAPAPRRISPGAREPCPCLRKEALTVYSSKRMKAAKIGYIALSALLCALGAALMAFPDFSTILLCRISGGFMIVFGLVKITGYCSRDLYRLAFQFDLAFGILLIALGALLVLRANAMVSLVCAILGICVLADALFKIQISIDSKAFGIRSWRLILTLAILTGAAGFALLLRPWESARAVMLLLGVSLLAEGLLNLVTILTAVQLIRGRMPKTAEAE